MFFKNISLLLCYVLANFLDFIRVLTTYVSFALCLLEGNVVSVNEFSNMKMRRPGPGRRRQKKKAQPKGTSALEIHV